MFFSRSRNLTEDALVEIARSTCARQGWPWRGTVRVLGGFLSWTVVTNYGIRGGNVRVKISKRTGQAVRWSYIPR